MFTVTTSSATKKIRNFIQNQNKSDMVGKNQNSNIDKLSMLDTAPKKEAKKIHVGKVRNFTDRDVILTLLDPKYKYSMAFALKDEIVLPAGVAGGVDLSKAIQYELSTGYTPLFKLQKAGCDYHYVVYAHCAEFVIQKFKVETQIGLATIGMETKSQVATYRIGDADNRCITIQMFLLECCPF